MGAKRKLQALRLYVMGYAADHHMRKTRPLQCTGQGANLAIFAQILRFLVDSRKPTHKS